MKVAVLGASRKPDRYSYKAIMLLRQHGHLVYPVNPALAEIEGIRVFPSLADIPSGPDVISVYLGPQNQSGLETAILGAGPKLVVFNPGSENPGLAVRLQNAGIETLNSCTLLLLKTGQFEALCGSLRGQI